MNLYEIYKELRSDKICVISHLIEKETDKTFKLNNKIIKKSEMDILTEHQCLFRNEKRVFTVDENLITKLKEDLYDYYYEFYSNEILNYETNRENLKNNFKIGG